MKRFASLMVGGVALACVFGCMAERPGPVDQSVALLSGDKLLAGYRDWRLVSVAHEEGDLDDIRAIVGNDVAIKSFRDGKTTFPDGAVIARLAWRHTPSQENNKVFGRAQSFVAGPPVNGIQFMVKDSKKYSATGGWSFSQFDDGKPVLDAAKIQSCFHCHAPIKDRDLVFTRYAP